MADVSDVTVRRRLRAVGLFGKFAVRKPFVSKKNLKERLQFAKAHRDWTLEQWTKVIFSDESRFQM
jgi:hypothetical protein